MADIDRNTLRAEPGRSNTDAPVIAAAPIERLLDELKENADRLDELAPGQGVAPVYESIRERLWEALREAREQQVWLSTAEAAERMNYSQSHVQHLCKRDEDDRPFTARKIGGAWRIAASTLPTLDAAA